MREMERLREAELFRARRLSREQIERGYEQILTVIDTKRLEQWAQTVMETEPPARKEAYKVYRGLGRQYDMLLADFEAWQQANPVPEEELEEQDGGNGRVPVRWEAGHSEA